MSAIRIPKAAGQYAALMSLKRNFEAVIERILSKNPGTICTQFTRAASVHFPHASIDVAQIAVEEDRREIRIVVTP